MIRKAMDGAGGKIILGLETGLGGGSIALLKNGEVIDFAKGSRGSSTSEDLLASIESLIARNRISKREIGLLAVSFEPGGQTGIRIGLAIAKGIGSAIPAEVFRISLMEAPIFIAKPEGNVICAFHTDRNGVYFKEFQCLKGGRILSEGGIKNLNPTDFEEFFENQINMNATFFLDREFAELHSKKGVRKRSLLSRKIIIDKRPPAVLVALAGETMVRPITQKY